MLGHLNPILCNLENDQKNIFWLNYCSVCASLRQHHGLTYSFVLNKEIVFVLIAFEKYIFEEKNTTTQITTQCPARLFLAQKKVFKHKITEISADLSVVLAYIKALDWYVDNPSFFKKIVFTRVKKKFDKIFTKFSLDFQNIIQNYIKITKENEKNFEKVQTLSGLLAKNTILEMAKFTFADTNYTQNIAEIFEHIGKIIGIADHLIDFEHDLITQQYNPIIENSHQNQNSYIQEYKKMLSLYYLSKNYVERNLLNENLPQYENLKNFSIILKNALSQLTTRIKANTPKSIFENYAQKDIILLHNDCGNCDCGGCDGCGCGNCDCGCCDCSEVCDGECVNCCNCCDCYNNNKKKQK